MLLDHLPSDFERNPPSCQSDISKAEKELGITFPRDYSDFLLSCNGGEGFIGDNYVILWKIEELVPFNNDYQVQDFAPGVILIGSNGGGEGYGFDRNGPSPAVIRIPFIGMAPEYAKVIATDFTAFIAVGLQ